MSIEKIFLILALFGSAKVAVDLILSPFKRTRAESKEQVLLSQSLAIAESLSKKNEALELENHKLRKLLASAQKSMNS